MRKLQSLLAQSAQRVLYCTVDRLQSSEVSQLVS